MMQHKKELCFSNCKNFRVNFPPSKVVYATIGEPVVSLNDNNLIIPNCNHKEADNRIVFHILHLLEQGLKRIEKRTVDTDVIVSLVGKFFELNKIQSCIDLWILFGVGKRFNSICTNIGEAMSLSPVFHALTGYDTILVFRGKGKKLAWQA